MFGARTPMEHSATLRVSLATTTMNTSLNSMPEHSTTRLALPKGRVRQPLTSSTDNKENQLNQPRKSVIVVRRLLASVVITPLVALAYLLIYALLVAYGATPTNTPTGILLDALMLGVLASLMFALAPLAWKRK
jgi:hypothetical protein